MPPKMTNRILSKKEEIISLFQKKVNITNIARIVDIDQRTVSKALVEWGMKEAKCKKDELK